MKMFNERMKARGQGGFTLIELLIVIAILGILAGVVVFAVGGVNQSAENRACATEAKTIRTAFEAARADSATNAYPASISPGLNTYLADAAAADQNFNISAGGAPQVVVAAGGDYDGTTNTACGTPAA